MLVSGRVVGEVFHKGVFFSRSWNFETWKFCYQPRYDWCFSSLLIFKSCTWINLESLLGEKNLKLLKRGNAIYLSMKLELLPLSSEKAYIDNLWQSENLNCSKKHFNWVRIFFVQIYGVDRSWWHWQISGSRAVVKHPAVITCVTSSIFWSNGMFCV